jgi:hypothetical protein
MDVLPFPPQGDDRDFAHFKKRIAEFRSAGQDVQIAGLMVFVRPTAPLSEGSAEWGAIPADGVSMLIPSQSPNIEVT